MKPEEIIRLMRIIGERHKPAYTPAQQEELDTLGISGLASKAFGYAVCQVIRGD